MSIFELYLFIALLPGLDQAANFLASACAAGFVVMASGAFIFMTDELGRATKEFCLKSIKPLIIIMLVSGGVAVATPNERQLLLIVGGYAATNSKEMAKLPENILGAANAYLQEVKKSIVEETKHGR